MLNLFRSHFLRPDHMRVWSLSRASEMSFFGFFTLFSCCSYYYGAANGDFIINFSPQHKSIRINECICMCIIQTEWNNILASRLEFLLFFGIICIKKSLYSWKCPPFLFPCWNFFFTQISTYKVFVLQTNGIERILFRTFKRLASF